MPRKARLLTMRVSVLILRSIAKRCVSKDEAMEVEIAPALRFNNEKSRSPREASRVTGQSEISNSRFSRSMITDSAALQFSRSALPNRMPLTAQLVSSLDFGLRRSTTTPTKGSQLGSDFLTAVAMATSSVAHLIRSRELADLRILARDNILRPLSHDRELS
ncbi:MAG: hypothetical protein ACREC2_05535 [Bradyrhizobium sp.]